MRPVLFALLPLMALASSVLTSPALTAEEQAKVDRLAAEIRADIVQALMEQHLEVAALDSLHNELDWKRFMCKPCKFVFETAKNELALLDKIEKIDLLPIVRAICKKYTEKVPYLEQTCENLAETVLDRLVEWLKEEGKKIDPERTCIFLHMC